MENPPKKFVKVYLSQTQIRILKKICEKLGIQESELLRQTFMEYAKSVSLVTEAVHGRI